MRTARTGTPAGAENTLKEKGFLWIIRILYPSPGSFKSITRGDDCCSQTLMLRTQDGIVNFVLSNATAVIDNRPTAPGNEDYGVL